MGGDRKRGAESPPSWEGFVSDIVGGRFDILEQRPRGFEKLSSGATPSLWVSDIVGDRRSILSCSKSVVERLSLTNVAAA